jgi:hypothetical protein
MGANKLLVELHHRIMVLFWYFIDEVGNLIAYLLLYTLSIGFTHEYQYPKLVY